LEGQPGTHPQPDIKDSVALPIQPLERGTVLFRLHQSNYGAIYFNPDPSWRFNAPSGKEYGVLYAALDYYAALRETLKPDKFNILSTNFLRSRCLSKLTLMRDLRLVDLAGAGLTRIGADGRLTTGSYQISQSWSHALYRHPDRVDGLYYCSRYDPSKLCVALYDGRVEVDDLEEQRVTAENLLDPSFDSELQQFLDRYGYDRDDNEDPSI
jgi:RES domain